MKEPTGTKNISGCLPPLFKTKADVIERNAVGTKTFTTGSKYRNLLRREVQHLTELHFLLPDLFLGPLRSVTSITVPTISTRSPDVLRTGWPTA